MTEIVKDAGGITLDWLKATLGDSESFRGAEISDFSSEPIGGGIIARMVRVELEYAGETDAPSSIVVKFPTDDPGSLGVAMAMGLYESETRFYQDIAPLLTGMGLPTCYAAAFDAKSKLFTLVLADLSGVTRPGDVLAESSLAECEGALSELVKFQAPLWNSADVAALSWIADTTTTYAVFDALPAGVEPFLERFGAGLDEKHVELFRSVLPKSGEWVRSWKEPTVVQHGDFRSDNMLHGTSPSVPAVTIIDFQTVRLGPPGVDAAYFLGSSLSTQTRRAAERQLIEGYHKQLVAAGVEDFDFEACWSAYCEGALYGVYLFVGMASQVESTERGDRLIVDQIKRYADMALDLQSAQVAGLL